MKFNQEIIDEIVKSAKEILKSEKDSLTIEKTCSVCAMIKDHGVLDELNKKKSR